MPPFWASGVSVPGPVNRAEGTGGAVHGLWNAGTDLRGILASELSLPVIVENNVKAFAEAELIYGSGKSHENIVFVKWGPGVGSALVLRKQIYESRFQKEAEIAHLIVVPEGRPCFCGRRGCLEAQVSTQAVAEQVRAACTESAMPELTRWARRDISRISAHNIAEWVHCGDPELWKILDRAIRLMACAITNILTMIAPDQTVIYGTMFDLPGFQEKLLQYCEEYNCHYAENRIVMTHLREAMPYIGPLALVFNELFLSGRIDA